MPFEYALNMKMDLGLQDEAVGRPSIDPPYEKVGYSEWTLTHPKGLAPKDYGAP